MTKYARPISGLVIETFVPPEGLTLAECFHADVVEQFIACDDDVAEGWTHQEGVFAEPVLLAPPPARLDPLLAVPALIERVVELERRVKSLEDRAPRSGAGGRSATPADSPN